MLMIQKGTFKVITGCTVVQAPC